MDGPSGCNRARFVRIDRSEKATFAAMMQPALAQVKLLSVAMATPTPAITGSNER